MLQQFGLKEEHNDVQQQTVVPSSLLAAELKTNELAMSEGAASSLYPIARWQAN